MYRRRVDRTGAIRATVQKKAEVEALAAVLKIPHQQAYKLWQKQHVRPIAQRLAAKRNRRLLRAARGF